jgi:hypothetical protein
MERARISGFIDSNSRNPDRAVTDDNKYHRKALGCVRTAERLHDPGERAKLLELARAYLGLARHVAERHDYATADRTVGHDERRLEDA